MDELQAGEKNTELDFAFWLLKEARAAQHRMQQDGGKGVQAPPWTLLLFAGLQLASLSLEAITGLMFSGEKIELSRVCRQRPSFSKAFAVMTCPEMLSRSSLICFFPFL